MYESDDIVGVTFSEFAFFVVFIFILLLVVAAHSSAQLKDQQAETARELDRTRTRVAELEQELAKRSATIDLRSRQRPSCIEKRVVRGFLFRATIVGPDRYVVAGTGTPVTLPDLMRTYAAEIDQASQADCVHSVGISYSETVSLSDYDRALKPLEQQFYISRLPMVNTQ